MFHQSSNAAESTSAVFAAAAAAGSYTGFPCLGVEWQKLENPDMRKALKMKVGDLLLLRDSIYQCNSCVAASQFVSAVCTADYFSPVFQQTDTSVAVFDPNYW